MNNIKEFISRWANLVESRDEEMDFIAQRAFSDSERNSSQLKDLKRYLREICESGLSMELVLSLVYCIDFNSESFRNNLKYWKDAEARAKEKNLVGLEKKYSSLVNFLNTLGNYGRNVTTTRLRDDGDEVYESLESPKLQMMILMMDENGYEQDGDGLEFSNLTGKGPEKLSFKDEKELEEFVVSNILRK